MRAARPYQDQIDGAEDRSKRRCATFYGLTGLRPSLLKCLFSYAFFFVAADNAYKYFYARLNRANRLLGLKVRHSKPPKQSAFVRKIGTIRDIAIAHFPSEKARPIDAFAAMTWEPMSLTHSVGGSPDLEKLTFGPSRLRGTDSTGREVESQDLEVSGLKTTHHKHCLPYLERYDGICCEYLSALHAAMATQYAPFALQHAQDARRSGVGKNTKKLDARDRFRQTGPLLK